MLAQALEEDEAGMLLDSANRSYYGMFHGVRALLALDGVDFKRHSGVISYFQEHYIKTGLFPKVCSDYLKLAFSIRQDADYEDFYLISKEEVAQQLKNAHQLLCTIEDYLNNLPT